jgi:DNA-binding LacI/PurR family transcriptional regulator
MAKKKKYKFDKTLKELKHDICCGKYKAGAFLPPERELVEAYDVSRGTLRKVLKQLVIESVIRINPRKGAFILKGDDLKRLRRFIVRLSPLPSSKASEGQSMLSSICRATSNHHTEALISFSEEGEVSSEIARQYMTNDIQGVILGDVNDYSEYALHLNNLKIPYVSVNLEHDFDIPSCKMDFREVARKAGRYLLNLGHKNIAFISGPIDNYIYKEMLAGLKGVLAEDDITLSKDNIIQVISNAEKSRLACLDFFQNSPKLPTAIFTSRDVRASGVYSACRELGIKIPEDISIISYDNITWLSAEAVGLTTIRENIEEMGAAAIDMLSEWIKTGRRPENKIFTGELIVRSSCKSLASSRE